MRRLPRTSVLAFLVWGVNPSLSLAFVVAGQVYDVRTGDGIQGLPVTLGRATDITGGDGRFRLEFSGEGRFLIDGPRRGFSVYLLEALSVSSDTAMTVGLVPLGPLDSGYYRNLLHFFKLMTGTGEPSRRAMEDVSVSYESSPRTTLLRRWHSLPIRVFVPDLCAEGFSWNEVFWRAADRWEERTGLDLFSGVDDSLEAQVEVRYGQGHSRVVFERAGRGGVPLGATLWVNTDLSESESVESAVEHELGHILMILVHSEDSAHLMYWGGSAGRSLTADEALLVRCIYGLPNLTDMSAYMEAVPPSRRIVEQRRVLAVVTIQVLLAIFVILGAS